MLEERGIGRPSTYAPIISTLVDRQYVTRDRSRLSATRLGEVVNDQVATLNFMYCHEDEKVATERGMQVLGGFGVLNSHLLFTREAFPTRAYQSLNNLAPSPNKGAGNPGDSNPVPQGICIGEPTRIIEAAKRWESIGVDNVNFILNSAEALPQEQVLDSLRLFAREVLPAFQSGAE